MADRQGGEVGVEVEDLPLRDRVVDPRAVGLFKVDGDVEAVVLSGPDADSYNDVATPEMVVPETGKMSIKGGVAEFPPHSVSIIKINIAT